MGVLKNTGRITDMRDVLGRIWPICHSNELFSLPSKIFSEIKLGISLTVDKSLLCIIDCHHERHLGGNLLYSFDFFTVLSSVSGVLPVAGLPLSINMS